MTTPRPASHELRALHTDLRRLAASSKARLASTFDAREPPDPASLDGWEYAGWNVFPHAASPLGIRKFIKGFVRDPDDAPAGYNVPVRQDGASAFWVPKRVDPPKRFGFYAVREPSTQTPERHGRSGPGRTGR